MLPDAINRLVGMRLDQQIRQRVDVSDVIQDVLIEANRRLQDYLQNPGMPFHLWLRHIAKDRIIDATMRPPNGRWIVNGPSPT